MVGLAGVPPAVPTPGPQTPVPQPEPAVPEEEPSKRGAVGGGHTREGVWGCVRGPDLVLSPSLSLPRALPGSCAAGPGGKRLRRSRKAENPGNPLPGARRGICCCGVRRELRLLRPWSGSCVPGEAPAPLGILTLYIPSVTSVVPRGGGGSSFPPSQTPQLGAGASGVGSGPFFPPTP